MLRDIHVPWHMMVPLTLACVLLFTFVPTALAISAVHAQRLDNGQPLHYLALGDSLAAGDQSGTQAQPLCPSDTNCGYVKDLFPKLQSQGFTEAKDLGCALGETSTTFLNGNGNCSDKTSQLNRALDYIRQGNVGLVTLNIGADELLPDITTLSQQKTCVINTAKFTTDLQTLKDNLPKILQPLHDALNGSGLLLLLNYYNAFQNICPETTQYVQQLNGDLATAIQPYGRLVNIFNVFGGDSPTPNQKLCTYTGMCEATLNALSIHPTAEGYQAMADAILSTINIISWVGYVASSGGNRAYTEANMHFTVPTLTGTPGKDTIVDIWVGVGGGGATSSQKLVRVGVESKIASNNQQTNRAFWEVGSDGSASPQYFSPDMNLAPNDEIWVYVGSNADHNSGYDGFLVQDVTHGTPPALHYEYDPNTFSDTATAECIVERPIINGSSAPLANFGHMTITGCGAYANGQTQYAMAPIGNFTPDQLNMTDEHNTPLAITDTLMNGGDFDVTWKNTGDGT